MQSVLFQAWPHFPRCSGCIWLIKELQLLPVYFLSWFCVTLLEEKGKFTLVSSLLLYGTTLPCRLWQWSAKYSVLSTNTKKYKHKQGKRKSLHWKTTKTQSSWPQASHYLLQAINIPLECPGWHFAFFSILPHTASVHSNRGSISEGGVLQSKQKQRNQLEWSFIKGEECFVFIFQGTARNLGLFCDILIEIYFWLFP